jgi:hypothetical protein
VSGRHSAGGAARAGRLVVNPVIYADIALNFGTIEEVGELLLAADTNMPAFLAKPRFWPRAAMRNIAPRAARAR